MRHIRGGKAMNEPIKDKAPKPPGLLPKNVQPWVIIGIALLMVVIMWLEAAGHGKDGCADRAGPSAGRSERNQDCRFTEPDSGSTEAPAFCAECPRAANPPARVFA